MLRLKALPTFSSKEYENSLLQNNTEAALNPVLATPLIDGNLLQNLTIPSTLILTVPHGLNRVPLGFLVVNANGAYGDPPWALLAEQINATKNLVLRFSSGSGVKISLWVF